MELFDKIAEKWADLTPEELDYIGMLSQPLKDITRSGFAQALDENNPFSREEAIIILLDQLRDATPEDAEEINHMLRVLGHTPRVTSKKEIKTSEIRTSVIMRILNRLKQDEGLDFRGKIQFSDVPLPGGNKFVGDGNINVFWNPVGANGEPEDDGYPFHAHVTGALKGKLNESTYILGYVANGSEGFLGYAPPNSAAIYSEIMEPTEETINICESLFGNLQSCWLDGVALWDNRPKSSDHEQPFEPGTTVEIISDGASTDTTWEAGTVGEFVSIRPDGDQGWVELPDGMLAPIPLSDLRLPSNEQESESGMPTLFSGLEAVTEEPRTSERKLAAYQTFYIVVGEEPVFTEDWRSAATELMEELSEDQFVVGRVTDDEITVFNNNQPTRDQLQSIKSAFPQFEEVMWGMWSKDVYSLTELDSAEPSLFPSDQYEGVNTQDPREFDAFSEVLELYRGMVVPLRRPDQGISLENLRVEWERLGQHWTDTPNTAHAFARSKSVNPGYVGVVFTAEVDYDDISVDYNREDESQEGNWQWMEKELTVTPGSELNLTAIEIYSEGELYDNQAISKKVTAERRLAGTEPIATVVRVDYKESLMKTVRGTGLLVDTGFDPVLGDVVAVVEIEGQTEYVPFESIRSCPIYDSFPGGEYDEVSFIIDGDKSYVWASTFGTNVVHPSHDEVGTTVLGTEQYGFYNFIHGVLRSDGVLKIFGPEDPSEEKVQQILNVLNGANITEIFWGGELFKTAATDDEDLIDLDQLNEIPQDGGFYKFLFWDDLRFVWSSNGVLDTASPHHRNVILTLREHGLEESENWSSGYIVSKNNQYYSVAKRNYMGEADWVITMGSTSDMDEDVPDEVAEYIPSLPGVVALVNNGNTYEFGDVVTAAVINEDGTVGFQGDDIGNNHKFILTPEGEFYAWGKKEFDYGKGMLAIENEGTLYDELDDFTKYEWERDSSDTYDFYRQQGYATGQTSSGSFFMINAPSGFNESQIEAIESLFRENGYKNIIIHESGTKNHFNRGKDALDWLSPRRNEEPEEFNPEGFFENTPEEDLINGNRMKTW